MIPGQLRPTFAQYDREKRVLMTVIAAVIGLPAIVLVNWSPYWWVSFVLLFAMLIVIQVVYAARIRLVRMVASTLANQFPADRFLVGNARYVGANDRGPEAVTFSTTILQFSDRALTLWDPDTATAFAAIPLSEVDVDVMKTKPPRWGLVTRYESAATYFAMFRDSGLGYRRSDELSELALELFPSDAIAIEKRPEGPTGVH